MISKETANLLDIFELLARKKNTPAEELISVMEQIFSSEGFEILPENMVDAEEYRKIS